MERPLPPRQRHVSPMMSYSSHRILPAEDRAYVEGPRFYDERGAPYPMHARLDVDGYESHVLPSIEMLPMRSGNLRSHHGLTNRLSRAPVNDEDVISIPSSPTERQFVPGSADSRMSAAQYPWPAATRDLPTAPPAHGYSSQAAYNARTTVGHNDRRYYEVPEFQPTVLRRPHTRLQTYSHDPVSLQTRPYRESATHMGAKYAPSYPDTVQSRYVPPHYSQGYSSREYIPSALV